jgi:hypothetical protein
MTLILKSYKSLSIKAREAIEEKSAIFKYLQRMNMRALNPHFYKEK